MAHRASTVTDSRPGRDDGPTDLDGESYRLAAPGPFGTSWTRATLGPTGLTLSGDGGRTTISYEDLRAVDSVPVRDEHGEARIAVDLVLLGATIVLSGGAALARRLTDGDVAPPSNLSRYANEVVATDPLVRLRLATDDSAYYLYADRETATSLSDELRERRELEEGE